MRKFFTKIIDRERKKPQASRSASPKGQGENDQGLKLIYDGPAAEIDVVAIHGDGGHWKRSWTDRDSGFFWLADILPFKFPKTRVFSYGYRTGDAISLEEIASQLIDQMTSTRIKSNEESPIIFIVHSFGGILIKGALGALHKAPESDLKKRIGSSTHAILLLGSPVNAEKELSSIAAHLLDQAIDLTESPMMKAMKRDARWLQTANQQFKEVETQYRMIYFREISGSTAVKSGKAINADGEGVIQLNKTHGAMIRFATAEDDDLKTIVAVLAGIIDEISL